MSSERPTNLWDILGIPPDSSLLEIKRAYAQKAKQIHPDVGFTALIPKDLEERNEKMKAVNEAYHELMSRAGGGTLQDSIGSEEEEFLRYFEIARFFLVRR